MTKKELPVLRAQLLVERERLPQVVKQLASLQQRVGQREPDHIELLAIAALLHNLYNAVENCLIRVAHAVDESVPDSADWHRVLLDQLAAPVEGLRPSVLERDLAKELDEYQRFRHAFRHMYFFDLEWKRVRPLLEDATRIHGRIDAAFENLLTVLIPPVR